jgi:hypothetical protein
MASYAFASATLLQTIARALHVQHAPLSELLRRGYPSLEVTNLLIVAPILESLILIGMVELLSRLGSPFWFQLTCPAVILALCHFPFSHAVIVAPGWFIMVAAYLMWRRVSWKSGFITVAAIHALLKLDGAIAAISYAVHHPKA